jgi:hypothetical protein
LKLQKYVSDRVRQKSTAGRLQITLKYHYRETERERKRETERGVKKDRSNTKFGPSFM